LIHLFEGDAIEYHNTVSIAFNYRPGNSYVSF